jgi:hypothetical protein
VLCVLRPETRETMRSKYCRTYSFGLSDVIRVPAAGKRPGRTPERGSQNLGKVPLRTFSHQFYQELDIEKPVEMFRLQ